MRITTLLLVGGIAAGALMVIAGVGVVVTYRDYVRAYDAEKFAHKVSTDIYQLTTLTGDYILHYSDRAAAQWRRKHASLDSLLSTTKFERTALEGDIIKFRGYHEKNGQLFSRSLAALKERRNDLTPTLQETALLSQLQTVMQGMASEAKRFSARHRTLMEAAQNRMMLFGGGFVGLMPVVFFVLWSFTVNRMIGPIRALREGMRRFGEGDLGFRFSLTRRDEIGEVAATFDDMADRLSATMASRDELNREIAERKRLEQQLVRSQRMEAVGQLTGGIAHDFNNLLHVMAGNAEFLDERIGGDPEGQRHIEAIKRAIDRASSLTQRLLAYSRKQTLSPEVVNVSELIAGMHDMLHRSLGETIDLKIEQHPGLWPALVDAHQLEDALLNLAINARDAMPKGGILKIETANVTLDRAYAERQEDVTPGEYVTVTVSDTGKGISTENLEKVFEPFFTTKGVGEGSGLGLSMVYGFAKQSGGHVSVASELSKGTAVTLYMPRSEEGAGQESDSGEAVDFEKGSERILLVEDDESVRQIPATILRNQGYEVVEAGDALAAIAHLQDGVPFDLLFTDVILPGGANGLEIAEQAKRLQPNIKILFTTGYGEEAFAEHGGVGASGTTITKPYRRADLLETVRTVIGHGAA